MLKGSKAEILKQVGDGLRMRRLFLNLTREIAAERSGISASTVKNIENFEGPPLTPNSHYHQPYYPT